MPRTILISVLLLLLVSCRKDSENDPSIGEIRINSSFINSTPAVNNGSVYNIDFNNVDIKLFFSKKVDTTEFNKAKCFFTSDIDTLYSYKFSADAASVTLSVRGKLLALTGYRLIFEAGQNLGGTLAEDYSFGFRTMIDSLPKFPIISDDSLLTLVQKKTFSYFWDHAHPVSGMARERYGSGEIVTSGGTGFGLMGILTGIRRSFITRQEGFVRINKIVNFLNNPATDRFHGAFSHWLNGTTGKVWPFSPKDNGGDLVETAFLMQGLLTVREYFKDGSAEEKEMCSKITSLWEKVEWDWYRRGGQNRLYWHWSPNFGWDMNMTVSGWNEALIVYVLAASSPTYPIPKTVYDDGWARNGAYPMKNGKTFAGIRLPLGYDWGGPLFFAHYSFLGLDPGDLSDQYADYWVQNVSHARINFEYCKSNPKKYQGYSKLCWGLTASDIQNGYSASSPTNDLGVIAPTAALSSFPYTPAESMDALKFFYYTLGDKLWGEYGFYDAFNLTSLWFASSYIAIDQGPIICMIENYRSGFLWDTFMESQEVQNGLNKLGITYQ